jgi:predicted secreted protein
MARPTTLSGGKLLVYIEEPVGSNTFVAPCGLTTKGFNQSVSSNDTNVPDCDDPDLPSYTERDVVALSSQISGSGVLAMEALPLWQAFYASGESRTCRVVLDNDAGGQWEGDFLLSSFNIGGERGNRASVEITLDSDGAWTWTAS